MKQYSIPKFPAIILLATILVISGTSCKKFLEEQDPSNLTPDNFYTIPQHAEAAIASAYAQTRFITGGANIISINYQMLDAVTGIVTTESAQNSDLNNLLGLAHDPGNQHVINWWNGIYRVIAQTNLVLDKVPGITPMDEAQKKSILGQASFLRAWAYFYAVQLWGDLPLILQPQTATSEDFYPSRTPVAQIYEQIVSDLESAEAADLPWTDGSGRVSRAAVKSLLAKAFLVMAGQPLNKGAEYYQKAAAKANEVITGSGINLFTDYNHLHDYAHKNQGEHIFQIQYNASIVANNDLQILWLPNFKPITAYTASFGTTVPTKYFFDSYEPDDLRTKDQRGFFYSTYFQGGTGASYDLDAPYIFKHFDVEANGKPGTPGTGRSSLNLPQIRYADVLLVYAEAQNEASGPTQDAYDALKKIRDRAQLTTPALASFDKDSFRKAVWRERWYELCFENVLWFDMIRTRKVFNTTTKDFDDFVGHVNLSSNRALEEKHLLFPLPRPEVQNNPNLTPQNPGY